ncbi:MAG: co-chaperone GroES family protein [Candidatus Omnitrophica bacterium]|nr:co-chaperone GroES family protein [Candidatus Omnitrophota bacterium]
MKELILVGDRVLIAPDEGSGKTETGLYLPEGVKEKEKMQAGNVVKVGLGYPLVDPATLEQEPWSSAKSEKKYFPLEAREGDYCIFLRNSAIEIEFERKKYLVVPHSAILIIVRDDIAKQLKDLEKIGNG